MNKTEEKAAAVFQKKLHDYKTIIDKDIAVYSKHVRQMTLQNYGKNARLEVDAFLDILSRGGKRIRGSLTMLGYEMSGGTNHDMIVQVARATEMIHAYILIIDDIQDRSVTRRGGKSAHASLADYHFNKELAGESEHFGVSIALNAALSGMHAAQMILANIDIDPQLRLNALSIINRTMMITAHGQTNDIMNEVVADPSDADIENVLAWKTAHYTFLNPLHVGMVLAGADCHATDAITDYAMNTGKAFQITDDIIGIFGHEQETGKSPMDDIREGKRTVLTQYALRNADDTNTNFLIQVLGKPDLTPTEFERTKDILIQSGALEHANKRARDHVAVAVKSLDTEEYRWTPGGVTFLRGLAEYLLTRVPRLQSKTQHQVVATAATTAAKSKAPLYPPVD